MENIRHYIESGIIEAYVLGLASSEETEEVEAAAEIHPDVRKAINAFSASFEQYALANMVAPDLIIKPMLVAAIDFINRMEKGETPSFPPNLNQHSLISDFSEWLKRADFIPPANFESIYAKIIAYSPEATTAIVWIKDMAPQEVHNNEYEKFLIIEGTCDIIIAEDVHHLVPGNFLAIPLYKNHIVKVTSDIPCKVILQRLAA